MFPLEYNNQHIPGRCTSSLNLTTASVGGTSYSCSPARPEVKSQKCHPGCFQLNIAGQSGTNSVVSTPLQFAQWTMSVMLPSILCSRVCCLDVLQLYTSRHDMLLFCCTARKFGDMHTPQHSLLNNQSHPQQHIPLCPESCSSVRHQDIPGDMHRAYKFALYKL